MDVRHCQVALGSNIPTSTYLDIKVSRMTTYLDIKVSRIMVLRAVIRGFGPLFHRVETLNQKKMTLGSMAYFENSGFRDLGSKLGWAWARYVNLLGVSGD